MPGPEPIPFDETGVGSSEDLRKAKAELRRRIARLVAAMSFRERADASAAVARAVLELPEFVRARSIIFYSALPDETDLGALVDDAISSGREVLFPITDRERHELAFASVEDPLRDLREGAYGILEPREGLPLADLSHVDLVLVPGRAFDREGGRLGRGKGYYDGFLARVRPFGKGGPFKLGVAFACQLVERVPVGPRDVRVDAVVTELGVVRRHCP